MRIQENLAVQNVEPYKRETVIQAFMSAELVAAVVGMSFFWFTIVSFDSQGGPGNKKATYTETNIMEQANALKPMQMAAAGQLVEATREAASLVQRNGHDPLANICAGNVFIMAGAGDDGLKYLKKGVALSSRNKLVTLNYAQKLNKLRHYDDAIAQYESLTKANPLWELPRMELAEIYFDRKQPAEAAVQLAHVVQSNTNNFAARKLRGIALARSGKLKIGLEEYMLAIAQETQSGPPEALRTLLGSAGNGAMDRVIFELQQQVNNRPDEYVPKLRLAQLYAYGGNPKEAKELMLDARRLAPNNPEVQRTLAVVLKQLGEDNQAMSAFGLSVKLEEAQEREKASRAL